MARRRFAPPPKYGGNIMKCLSGNNNAAPTEEQRPAVGIASPPPLPASKELKAAKKEQEQAPTAAVIPSGASPSVIPEALQETIAANVRNAADRHARQLALQEALTTARRQAAEKVAAGLPLDPLLNDEQTRAVEAPIDRPLMVVAGAGSGKTRTIIYRTLHMILLKNVHPASILLISFTVKAAKEAQQRLEQLNCPGSDLIRVGTFHSFCFSVLRTYFRFAGFEKCPTVIAENKDLKRIMSIVEVRSRLERHKEQLCTWLQLPMLRSSWQDVIDEVQTTKPQLYRRAAETAAQWFVKHGVTKKRKKKAAPVKKKPAAGAQKRKAAAASTTASDGTGSTQGSPSKQLRLAVGAAGVSTSASAAIVATAAAVAAPQEEELAATQNNEEDGDPAVLTAAGKLDKMPRELQTVLFAHIYDAFYLCQNPQAYDQELRTVNQSRRTQITSLAASLLKPLPAKEITKHLRDLESYKTRGLSLDTIVIGEQQRLFKMYQEELQAQNAVDFNDLLLKVQDVLQNYPHIGVSLHRKYPYLIVDEFQDTNFVQMTILNAIAPPTSSLTVVGDGDQSIYGFRGAEPHIMEAFKTVYEAEGGLHRQRLEMNYRSTSQVLDIAAAALVGNRNIDPSDRLLPTKTDSQEKAVVRKCENTFEEADWIVQNIRACMCRGTTPQEIAVLFRKFKSGGGPTYKPLQEKLENAGIPYRIVRETSLLERAMVKDILSYVDLLLTPENDAAFLRVMNTPKRRLGKAVEQRLLIVQDEHAAQGRHASLLQCAKELVASGQLVGLQAKNMKHFIDLIEDLGHDILALRPAEVLDRIIERSDYLKYLEEEAEKALKKKLKKALEQEEEQYPETNGEQGEEEDEEDCGEADEDDEDSDDDDDEEEDSEEEVGDASNGTSTGDGASTSKVQQRPTAAQWPYTFKCNLKGPLRRLRNEAIRWVREHHDPQLSSGGGEEEDVGPARLENLCLAALATPAGTFHVTTFLKDSSFSSSGVLHSNLNRTVLETVLGASACGPVALRDFQSYLRLNQSDLLDARPDGLHNNSKKKNKKQHGEGDLSSAELGVNISTIHAAKGLEWDVVFVPHFNSGFLPAHDAGEIESEELRDAVEAATADRRGGGGGGNMNGNGEARHGIEAMAALIGRGDGQTRSNEEEALDQVEEERRLAHVAVTRAREKLFMSYLCCIQKNGIFENVEISPILEKIVTSCRGVAEIDI